MGRRSIACARQPSVSAIVLPLLPFKIIAAIHWEALRLWLKGARLVPRNDAARNTGLNTVLATGKGNDYTSPALSAHAKD